MDCSGLDPADSVPEPDVIYLYRKELEKIVEETMERLNVSQIEVLYLHRFEQVKNSEILIGLQDLKKKELVNKIGVSIYEPNELIYILSFIAHYIDVVQLPYNILDNIRWDELIKQSHEKNIEIFIRSVFLQGLLFKELDDPVIENLGAEKYIQLLRKLQKQKNVSMEKLLFDFCFQSKADGILLGCETEEQIMKNAELFNQSSCLCDKDIIDIKNYVKDIDKKIIDPRKW